MAWRRLPAAVMAAGALGVFEARSFVGREAPDVTSLVWINSRPLSIQALRGSVVLVEFWTSGCFNCRNVEPRVKAWYQRYADRGLGVVGVHTPEFAYEKDIAAVTRYVTDHDIRYPVVTDNNYAIWNRYGNHYWPAMYLIDKRGIIRYVRVGEGGYDDTERMIQALLAEPISPQEDHE
ncbi:MAG: redoxin domain-containing protein [Nitrospirae bacterium]|nr:redoxin domain-containing protein [Nitrospirota bacterium]